MCARIVIETKRLRIRWSEEKDAAFYLALWRDPQVMGYVGFPFGLKITLDEVKQLLANQPTITFGHLLVVENLSGQCIGECKMYLPDENGVSRTDVKLLPAYWGFKFGVEGKRALVDHLFMHTECRAVEGSPNVANIASIKMQEAVGGVPVRQETFNFPESMRSYTQPVHSVIYLVHRSWWETHRRPKTALELKDITE